MKLSAVVLTKNEEEIIERCIESLKFCDEIVVVDDNSNDRTVEKCKKSNEKCRIFKRGLENNFALQRNFGLKKATGDWVLIVDADELVSSELAGEIKQKINNEAVSGYYLKRRDIFMGKELKHGETANIKLLRLAKKDSGVWKRSVHEYWDVNGKSGDISHPLIHYAHLTLYDFISDLRKYSEIHFMENLREGKNSNILKIVLYPLFKFLDGYIIKMGFLDGVDGFVFSILMSFHSYLSWSNLWLYQKDKR